MCSAGKLLHVMSPSDGFMDNLQETHSLVKTSRCFPCTNRLNVSFETMDCISLSCSCVTGWSFRPGFGKKKQGLHYWLCKNSNIISALSLLLHPRDSVVLLVSSSTINRLTVWTQMTSPIRETLDPIKSQRSDTSSGSSFGQETGAFQLQNL